MAIVVDEGEIAIFNAIGAAFNGAMRAILFQNAHLVTDATTLSDLIEADYSGYAEMLIYFSMPSISAPLFAADVAKSVMTECVFAHDGGGVGNGIYGWAVVYNHATVITAGNFAVVGGVPVAKPMIAAGDVISLNNISYCGTMF